MRIRDALACAAAGALLGAITVNHFYILEVADLEAQHLADLTYLSASASDCDRQLRALEDLSEREVCLGLLERNVQLETEVVVLGVRLRSAEADCLRRIAMERLKEGPECE